MLRPAPKPKHRKKASKKHRGDFPKSVRDEIYQHYNYQCYLCMSPATEIHHVHLRSRSGRGVFENGCPLCTTCHQKAHHKPEVLRAIKEDYVRRYGADHFKDERDKLEEAEWEYAKKLAEER
ncbi:HNH endonuclease [Salsuginibacillus halophilus]|uniref:HNH endonuclease n=1 Tax=Salsuginibacillus halophilus TaxID=517424 RepID=A0A2P8H699_9BACI|nr:HNH endonuclease [Salsuginibacillus halophilus]